MSVAFPSPFLCDWIGLYDEMKFNEHNGFFQGSEMEFSVAKKWFLFDLNSLCLLLLADLNFFSVEVYHSAFDYFPVDTVWCWNFEINMVECKRAHTVIIALNVFFLSLNFKSSGQCALIFPSIPKCLAKQTGFLMGIFKILDYVSSNRIRLFLGTYSSTIIYLSFSSI